MARQAASTRTCVVTREKLPKQELWRFVINPEAGGIVLDPSQIEPGRGAYTKKDQNLLKSALDKGILNRHLRLKSRLDKAQKQSLLEEVSNKTDQNTALSSNG